MSEAGEAILADYFGVRENGALLPWPMEVGGKILEHESGITAGYVRGGYKSRPDYYINKRAIEMANLDSLSRNHLMMMHAAMIDFTDAGLMDEILA